MGCFIYGFILAFYVGAWFYIMSNIHMCVDMILGYNETFNIETVIGEK